jgi:hypothetical protein
LFIVKTFDKCSRTNVEFMSSPPYCQNFVLHSSNSTIMSADLASLTKTTPLLWFALINASIDES